MTFQALHIIPSILKALETKGYKEPTPIQQQSIPILLRKKDLLGVAQTGTGKTAAFAIPIVQNIELDRRNANFKGKRRIKALIVTPTRELAIQVADNFVYYGKNTSLKTTVIFGGVKQGAQVTKLRGGIDILVATPGRLLDLIGQGIITLQHIEYFVLDEADQMLEMGFIHDIKKLLRLLPVKRQSLFFSATMPPKIKELSSNILASDYETVTIKPQQATAERVEQSVFYVAKQDKIKLLIHLLEMDMYPSVLVFSRTKHGADKIVKKLARAEIRAAAIHGNKSQNARQKALKGFKDGRIRVLVATDIAARGIDVSDLSLVINYDLPNVPETYVHRIGRTGRAKASGLALSFCTVDERPLLRDIERLIKQEISLNDDQPYVDDEIPRVVAPQSKPKPKNGSRNRWKNRNKRRKVRDKK